MCIGCKNSCFRNYACLFFLFLQNNREKLLLHWAKWGERRLTGWPRGLGGMRGRDGNIYSFWKEHPDPARSGWAVSWGSASLSIVMTASVLGSGLLGWKKTVTYRPRSGSCPGDLGNTFFCKGQGRNDKWNLLIGLCFLKSWNFHLYHQKKQNTGWQQCPCFCQVLWQTLEKEMAIHSSIHAGNPMDKGTWWATARRVAKSQT